jgi:hypothetical protein
MSAARFNDDFKRLKPGDRLREAINADRLNALAELAQDAANGRFLRGGRGTRVSTGPAGTTISGKGSRRRGAEVPWTVRSDYSIVPGTINGLIMPQIGAVRLDANPAPVLTIPSSGVRYVFLKFQFTIVTNADGFLSSWTLSQGGVTVEVTTNPSPTQDEDTKYLLLNTCTDGTPSNSFATYSPIPVTLFDNGLNSTLLRVGNL